MSDDSDLSDSEDSDDEFEDEMVYSNNGGDYAVDVIPLLSFIRKKSYRRYKTRLKIKTNLLCSAKCLKS